MRTSQAFLLKGFLSLSIIFETSSLTFQMMVLKVSPWLGLPTVVMLIAEVLLYFISQKRLAFTFRALRDFGHLLHTAIFAAGFSACAAFDIICSKCVTLSISKPLQPCEGSCSHALLTKPYFWAIILHATITLSEFMTLLIIRRLMNS